ncbi:sulfotransferase domain-containing protein [Candidatus Pelagibacter bacterium]|nr:sulfotransferase domain-containing protein [Candidatus Pelagibacter bacterium]
MIFWIASYPKSGNTWLRALLSSYYYSKDGKYDQSLIKKIGQFPEKRHFKNFEYNKDIVTDTSKYWIKAQEKINLDNSLRFFKTHNSFGALNNNQFTDKKNSIGGIYIIRDPRNVITSLKNHYELNDDQALEWMMNEKNFIYDVGNFEKDGYSDFQFISSWRMNYKSWKIQSKIPIKIVKYEDLLSETFIVFKDIINFINEITFNKEKINIDKLKNSVSSTFFDKLKDDEKKNGFSESIISKKNKKKIPFFYLGPKNDWKKILSEKLQTKISDSFKNEFKELGYK